MILALSTAHHWLTMPPFPSCQNVSHPSPLAWSAWALFFSASANLLVASLYLAMASSMSDLISWRKLLKKKKTRIDAFARAVSSEQVERTAVAVWTVMNTVPTHEPSSNNWIERNCRYCYHSKWSLPPLMFGTGNVSNPNPNLQISVAATFAVLSPCSSCESWLQSRRKTENNWSISVLTCSKCICPYFSRSLPPSCSNHNVTTVRYVLFPGGHGLTQHWGQEIEQPGEVAPFWP